VKEDSDFKLSNGNKLEKNDISYIVKTLDTKSNDKLDLKENCIEFDDIQENEDIQVYYSDDRFAAIYLKEIDQLKIKKMFFNYEVR
ncbi:MAG: hypothetical protein LBM02_06485, partial [Lachnospiraceae bacterium]|nr:hypothetical protein [Lachnospiraceae bacterium]